MLCLSHWKSCDLARWFHPSPPCVFTEFGPRRGLHRLQRGWAHWGRGPEPRYLCTLTFAKQQQDSHPLGFKGVKGNRGLFLSVRGVPLLFLLWALSGNFSEGHFLRLCWEDGQKDSWGIWPAFKNKPTPRKSAVSGPTGFPILSADVRESDVPCECRQSSGTARFFH